MLFEFNISQNESVDENENSASTYGFVSILSIIFVLGIFFNLTALIAIILSKKIESLSLLILNLALADIVYIIGNKTKHIFYT